ncbi:DMP19 family protein [uncultured Bacteroides sp.]|uniref:DMP19 family protein n=1 Tax=uncultured Bacteroides sp. TaxID=162156 RepID=UPI002AAAFA2F|nr:DMP19 family protein [uncultured Bacteroides sp.]
MATTIQISDSALKEAASLGMDEFLNVFTNKYLEIIGGDLNADKMNLLNGFQHSVLAYHFFREEVMEGGFVQLIQNGYGGYVFDNPFAKSMRMFGAEEFAKLIYKAKKIYDAHKEDLEKERSEDDFMAMYEQYEEFDDLEEEFLNSEEEVSSIIAEYIDEHLEEFANIK